MLSRIAESLFWMNRYMERAEGLLRLASTHYILCMDKDTSGTITWKPVLQLYTTTSEKKLKLLENNTEGVLKTLLADDTNTNSLKVIINKARENARGAQDHITKEVWEEINQIYHLVNNPAVLKKLNSYEALEVMVQLTKHAVLYAGVIDITMPRGTGWCFMSMGRYVERCLQTIILTEKQLEIMDLSDEESNDILQWRYLLLSLSGYELHLKTYRTSNHNYNVLHQILIDENFPRSIVYSLRRINHYLDRSIPNKASEEGAVLLSVFGRLYSKVKFMDLSQLNHTSVQTFLKEVKFDLLDLNHRLQTHFFSYS